MSTLGITGNNFVQWVEPFNRKNLFYEVRYHDATMDREEKFDAIANFIKQYRVEARERDKALGIDSKSVCGIIYCRWTAVVSLFPAARHIC